jgi:tRNA dimethylallyltransferase
MGATATGKSAAGVALARRFDGEIISMDSRQVYRGLDIGTGKITADEAGGIPHHLIDILDPNETTSAGAHARRAWRAARSIAARARTVFLVGGTGLYFRAFLEGLADVAIPPQTLRALRERFEGRDTGDLYAELVRRDPERAQALSPNDRMRITRALEIAEHTGQPASEALGRETARPNVDALKLVLTMPREQLRARIAERTRAMFAAGWVAEVRRALEAGVGADAPGMNSLGYADIAAAVLSGQPPEAVLERVITLTRQYAKRQETFFRGERDAEWIDVTEAGAPARMADRVAEHLGAQ